jgi:inhibitor of cysteine peptidase
VAKESGAIAAPAPAGAVALKLTAADKGGSFKLKQGERVSVSLVGVPTAGYVWAAAALPSFLTKTEEASGPTSKAQLEPGFAGGNHWEVLVFEATAKGSGVLKLEQRRPWETNEAPADSWTATITVE